MEFDGYAKHWDSERRMHRAQLISEEIKHVIGMDKNQTAMEFGCGTGLISFLLSDRFKNITLIDSSKEMIDVLNSKITRSQTNNMTACCIDLMEGKTIPMKFDVIYSSMALHHVHRISELIQILYELLHCGGCLYIVDLNEDDGSFHREYPEFDGHNGFQQNKLQEILMDAGFTDIQSNTFFFDQKMIAGEIIPYSLFLMTAKKVSETVRAFPCDEK